jgi:hypothetical protein
MKIAIVLLLRFGPNSHVTALVNLHMDNIRAAANRTILDILLAFASRQVHRNHDLLATGITDVAGLLVRSPSPIGNSKSRRNLRRRAVTFSPVIGFSPG